MTARVAVVTYLLTAVNVMIFLLLITQPSVPQYDELIYRYGLKPALIMDGKDLLTLFTSMFLHADIIHLALNMLFLLIAGEGCERAMGSSRFLVFYLTCGVFSGLFHAYMNRLSDIPTIGASGAIFGVLAAFAIMFPFKKLIMFFGFFPLPIPAIVFVFVVVFIETAYVMSGAETFVAHTAHIGGFLAGFFLTLLFGPKKHEIEEAQQ